jgi:hypothetical protein
MRLWLKDSERKPDPTPVATDDRLAVLIGLGLWIAALVVALVVVRPLDPTLTVTIVTGIAVGLAGIVYTQVRRRRA